MGSANGCCKNPNVDNLVINNGTSNNGYGGAWGDSSKAFTISQQQHPFPGSQEVIQKTGSQSNGHTKTLGAAVIVTSGSGPPPVPGGGVENFRRESTSNIPATSVQEEPTGRSGLSTSKAMGSVLFMFMNTFSHQPRELLIALGGGGGQVVRPASFKLEDSETVKTATTTEIAEVDVESDVIVTSGLNVPDEPLNNTLKNRDRRRSSILINTTTKSTPLIPPDVHNAAINRIINSLNMMPGRRGPRSARSSDSA